MGTVESRLEELDLSLTRTVKATTRYTLTIRAGQGGGHGGAAAWYSC